MARRFSVLAVVPLFLLTTTVMADETEQAATEQKPQTYTEKNATLHEPAQAGVNLCWCRFV